MVKKPEASGSRQGIENNPVRKFCDPKRNSYLQTSRGFLVLPTVKFFMNRICHKGTKFVQVKSVKYPIRKLVDSDRFWNRV